jgi:hypothetical protein
MPESEAREVIDLVGEEEEEMCAPSSRMKGIAASHERGVSRHVGQSQPRCRLSPASSEGKGETDDDVVMLEQSPVAAVCAMTDLEGKTAGVEEKRGGRKRPRPRTMYLRLQAAQGWEEGDKTAMQIKKHGQGAAGGGGGGGRGSGYGEWQLSVTQDTEVEASMHEWRQLVGMRVCKGPWGRWRRDRKRGRLRWSASSGHGVVVSPHSLHVPSPWSFPPSPSRS